MKSILRTTNSEPRTGFVVSVNTSNRKGISKIPVESIKLKKDYGVEDDAHGGGKRQVSILTAESGNKIEEFKPGLFAENITTKDIELNKLYVGDTIKIGKAILSLSEKGKVCPSKCSIYYKLGDCIMPKEGLFFNVIKEGIVKAGDIVEII